MKHCLFNFFHLAGTVIILSTLSVAAEAHWTWCGWGGGGWYWSAAFDPTNANTLYMGGDVVGVYRTLDGGRNWTLINRGLQNYAVYSVTAAHDGKTVYALTQDGVAVSTDNGDHWTPCADTRKSALNISGHRGGSVHALATDPANPKIVLAGGGNGRLARSTDGGNIWTAVDYLEARKPDPTSSVTPASGAGYARITMASANGDWRNYVRIQKFISQGGEDWSGYDTISACFRLPPEAPAGMAATIVIQSGDGWIWKESPMTPLKPGEWTTVTGKLSAYTAPTSCRMVHLVVRPQGKGFKGELGIDNVKLTCANGIKTLGEWNGADLEGWRKSPDKETQITQSLEVSKTPSKPLNSPISSLVMADSSLVFLCHGHYGLFRSTDGGLTWEQPANVPKNARNVMGTSAASNLFFGAFGKDGLWKSEDAGVTWTNIPLPGKDCVPVRDLAVHPQNPQILHLVIGDGFAGFTMTSHDGGQTWTKNGSFTHDHAANPTLPDSTDNRLSGLKNIALAPTQPDRLFLAGNWSPCLSEDGGKTWCESCRGADITCFHDIRFLDGHAYAAAMDEGSFVSADCGASWQALAPRKWEPGLSGHQWRVLPQKLADGRIRVIATVSPWAHGHDFPVKVIVSEDGGKTFTVAQGLPDYRPHANTMWGEGHGRALVADPAQPDVLYLGIDGDPEKGRSGGGLFKSEDGGKNWRQLEHQPDSRRMFYGLAVDPTSPKRIYWGACGGGNGVYVSDDAGNSWRKSTTMNDWIFNVDVAPSGTVYAAGSQLYRSTDHGASWQPLTRFSGVTAIGIAIDPANENRLWCSTTTWSGDAVGGIYESTDAGRIWTDITGDIPYVKPLVLRYDAVHRELWAAGVAAYRLQR